ncbi:S8 family serine peptidase [Halosolutus gelatinilyticus]|uniref:S8 family serine peptidase n=1 Tax=Halosolutus gelatinilyticus TaxID=2931975 RepID=UPI001FF66855|nr:S8 family serine peptidase [Halosolutus gelatinilyticus]
MQRRQFLSTIGATAVASTTPSFIGPIRLSTPEVLTPLALADDVDLDTFGTEGNPSFALRYESAEDRTDLRKWVESTDEGHVIRDLKSVNMIVATVPWSEAGRSRKFGIETFDGGFDDLSYLEFADANTFFERPEPIGPDGLASSADDVSHDLRLRDRISIAARTGRTSVSDGIDGLAFDGDAPETNLRNARRHVRAGDGVLDTVDTSTARVTIADTGADDGAHFDAGDGTLRFHDDSTDYTGVDDPTVGEDGASAVADGDGHGSWVSACIGANNADGRYSGFVQDAELVIAKVLGDDGSGSIGDIVAGVELAIETNSDVLCMSLGSAQWSDALAAALADAWEAGVFPVVASGNDRYATTFVAHPASAEDGFAVNATNVPESEDRDDTEIAYFGNVGPHSGIGDLSNGESEGATPQLAAPGMNIKIEPVGTLTGTSMAAPMVAGAAAVLAADGHDNETILDRLTTCAYPIPNAGYTETENGLLDLEAALNGDEYEEEQANVRSEEAEIRDTINEAYSETRGRKLAGLF